MARDRRRAKQRRDRRARAGGAPSREADGTQQRHADGAAPLPEAPHDAEHLHDHEPAELASGDRDLAEAQLEIGRPELTEAADEIADAPDVMDDPVDLPELADEEDFEALEDRVDEVEEAFEEGDRVGEGGAVATRSRRRAPARTAEQREGGRLMTFLRGSWRELQRVQWPDRRQVGQATAVVIGFVIVAGAFLGLADYVAGKIVDFII
ncbi:MAG TPA: preprotein translocase subunit SecE [Conexibacter sp.]|nr:preprotein translocase subunit SecE [Conexibacter sp.]